MSFFVQMKINIQISIQLFCILNQNPLREPTKNLFALRIQPTSGPGPITIGGSSTLRN